MPDEPIWISEPDVVSLLNIPEAIDALEKGLLAEASGQAENMVKTHVAWGGGSTLHAIGASFAEAGFVGTKTWAHTSGGATPLLILFDSNDGSLKAVIEAFAMGQMRTAAISGLATRWLSQKDASEFAMIGTGKQAITQVAAIVAVRPIRHIRVFALDNRRAFAEKLRQEFSLEVSVAETCQEAVQGAQVITTATRATEPFLTSAMVSPGTHVNSIGAIVRSRAEVAQDLVERADRIAADSKAQAMKLSRELMDFCSADPERWKLVQPLSQILAAGQERSPQEDLTLFKSLGMGISDLSVGIEIYTRARAQGMGRQFAHPGRTTPRLK